MGTCIYEQHVMTGGSFDGSGGFASCTLTLDISVDPIVDGDQVVVRDLVTSVGGVTFVFMAVASLLDAVPASTPSLRYVPFLAADTVTLLRNRLLVAMNASGCGIACVPSGADAIAVTRLRGGAFVFPDIVATTGNVNTIVATSWAGGLDLPAYDMSPNGDVAIRRPLAIGGELTPEWALPGSKPPAVDDVFARGTSVWEGRVLLDIHAPNTELSLVSPNGSKRVIYASAGAPASAVLTAGFLATYGERLVLTTGVATAPQFARLYARPTLEVSHA